MSVEPITEEDITALTNVFYAWVRKDDLLGPVFAAKVGTKDEEWAPHIQHINDFWSGIFLKTGRFSGNPMAKHAALPGLTPAHFTRWLELFAKAGAKTLPLAKQTHFNATAERIAKSLQMGLAFHNANNDIEPNPFAQFDVVRPSRTKT
jgi:hemoglobin